MLKDVIVTREETQYDFGSGVVVSASPAMAQLLAWDLERVFEFVRQQPGLDRSLQDSACRLAILADDIKNALEK